MEPYTYRLLQIQLGLPGSDFHCLMFDYTIDQARALGPDEAFCPTFGAIPTNDNELIYVRDVEVQSSGLDVLSYLDVTTTFTLPYHDCCRSMQCTLIRKTYKNEQCKCDSWSKSICTPTASSYHAAHLLHGCRIFREDQLIVGYQDGDQGKHPERTM
jgi:hypothetical protein